MAIENMIRCFLMSKSASTNQIKFLRIRNGVHLCYWCAVSYNIVLWIYIKLSSSAEKFLKNKK